MRVQSSANGTGRKNATSGNAFKECCTSGNAFTDARFTKLR